MGADKEDVDDLALIEAHARRTSGGVYLAVCLFGMAGTLAAHALWIMVPVSDTQLPVAHRIPQYLVGLMEFGNISAAIFLLTRRCSRRRGSVNEAPAIYVGLAVSVAAMALLALFWEDDHLLHYGRYSIIYLAAAFGVGQVTCLAAMTYLPFVARMKASYITALLLGESLATLLAHTLAVGEGISRPPPCEKHLNVFNSSLISGWRPHFRPTTTIRPAIPPVLRFNASIYFFVMTGVLCIASFCFLVLRCIPSVRFEYDQIQVDCMEEVELGTSGGGGGAGGGSGGGGRTQGIEDEADSAWNIGHTNSALHATPAKPVILDDGSIKQPFARGQTPSPLTTPNRRNLNSRPHSRTVSNSTPQRSVGVEAKPSDSCMDMAPSFCLLMLITLWTSLFLYGPLSSVKAHGCLPIGNDSFIAGTLLTSLTPIVVIIVALRVTSESKVTLVVAFTSLGTILLTYFVALIAFSHESESREDSPIFQNNGELLTTVAWVAITGLFYFARVTIAVVLRAANKDTIIWFAGVTQVGAAIGTLCMLDSYSICRVYRDYRQIVCDAELS